MQRFNQYNTDKNEAIEKQEMYVREEKKLKNLEKEMAESGWEVLEHNPDIVEEYVKFITRYNK
jgi:recombinational DNA repair ATPase RecF|tara:strand:+ start:360 stop:548 length:189 start_codon:yes stop_codon:yes gene_type:complete